MIKILDNWFYKIDDFQYILIHQYERPKIDFKTKQKTDEMISKTEEVGYFPSLEEMLMKLAKILVKEKYDRGEINSLQEHIRELHRIKAELIAACRGE